jgi:hypothetical protein
MYTLCIWHVRKGTRCACASDAAAIGSSENSEKISSRGAPRSASTRARASSVENESILSCAKQQWAERPYIKPVAQHSNLGSTMQHRNVVKVSAVLLMAPARLA